MSDVEQTIVIIYLVFSFIGFIVGARHSIKGNSYGFCHIFNLNGAFVWADAFIFGLFWSIVSIFILIVQSFILFALILSVFWLIRSLGEALYWFNQQFSTVDRNPPHKVWFYPLFKSDAVWFVNQIFWQCVAVISFITSLKLAHMWLF